MNKTGMALLALVGLVGCSTVRHAGEQPQPAIEDLCKAGKYHAAMRALPKEMAYWAEYEKRTGDTAEGAGSYVYWNTLFTIAEKGDADWGKILDDPDIPYAYKVELVFEILEARLGKGSVYIGSKENLVVPRHRPANLEKKIMKLPEK